MDLNPNLLDLGAVLLFSFLGVLVSSRLKLPSIIGVLFFGMLIGPNMLGIIHESEVTSLLFDIGAILLLFFIGLEFNIDKISRFWLRASFVMVAKFGIIFFFTYLFSVFFGFPLVDSILMGLLLSFSSTAVFARLVAGTPQQGRSETGMMSAVLIIEDIFAVFLLTLLPQLGTLEHLSFDSIILPILVSLAILFVFYIGLKRAIERVSGWLDESNTESQLFLSLSLCAVLAFLSSAFGLSPSIGAFFAGSAVSAIPIFRKVEGTLQQLFILFSAFFFFAIGMQVDPLFIYGSALLVLAFTLLNIILKFFAVSLPTYIAGFDSRESVFSAIIMLAVSEFALLISTETGAISSFDFVSFSSALIVLTGLVAAVFYPREAALSSRFNAGLGKRVTFSNLTSLSVYLGGVFRQFESGGEFHEALLEKSRGFLFYSFWLVIANLAVFGLEAELGPMEIPLLPVPIGAFEAAAILISIYPLYRIFGIFNMLISRFSDAFYTENKEKLGIKEKMLQDAFFASFFFLVSVFIPVFLSALGMPVEFQVVSLVPMGISIIFLWDLGLLSAELLRPLGRRVSPRGIGTRELYEKLSRQYEKKREKKLRAQEEPQDYLLSPVSLLLAMGKSAAEKPKSKKQTKPKTQNRKRIRECGPQICLAANTPQFFWRKIGPQIHLKR